jgi:RNA polymerase I-specific transcription initiation factor RRN7
VPQQILNLFPLEESISKETVQENEADPTSERLKRMGESLVWQKPVAPEDEEGTEIYRAGNFYRYYRSVDSLPDRARTFYDKAGKLNKF